MAAARQEMEKITTQRRVAAALKHRAGALPHPMYEFGDRVRVWREKPQKCEGPYPVHSCDNRKRFFVHIGDRIIPFSTSVVKIVHPDESEAPSTETTNHARKNYAPPPQTTAQVPPEIASE